jgi:signal transduction histidine kinase
VTRIAAWLGLRPVDITDLPAVGHARLMDTVYHRIRTSMAVMSLVYLPFLWAASERLDDTAVRLWFGFYLLFMLVGWGPYLLYRRDSARMDAETRLRLWGKRINGIALLHGAGLSASVPLAAGLSDLAYLALLAIALGHIASVMGRVAGFNATPGHVLRYIAIGINPATLLLPWVFPGQWMFMLPLAIVYAVVIYRTTHSLFEFMVRQIRLEQESQQLATLYKAEKERAEEALREKDLFLSTASHDLRQPIHAMSLLVEAIARRNQDPALAPLLADLRGGMGSMNLMFDALLDLSKLEAGAVAHRGTRVCLQQVMQDIHVMFREQAVQRGLDLRLRVPGQDAFVWADAAMLRQALVNLVHNALRYTPQGGVLFGLRRRGADWQVEVWDSGVGVAAEDGAQIFSPWYRQSHAWHLDSAGHGLGLAVVARCARLLGATVGFQSRLGQGSRFWLRMPSSARAVSAPLQVPMPEPPRQGLTGHCLVLDDDPQVIAAWRHLLQAWGVDGRFAGNAAEAFACLDAGFVPDAVFCDQRLRSGESGFEILRGVLARCPQARGAMVSGELHSTELQEAEADGYLVLRKPMDPAELHALLSAWLPQREGSVSPST